MHRLSTHVPNRSASRWHAHPSVVRLICGVLIAGVAVGIEVQGVSRPVQSGSAQADAGVRPLIVGQSDEHDLRPGQADAYQIRLSEGQYVYVTVAQDGVDVTMTLRGPGGQPLVVLDSVAALHGLEALHWIADTSGSYRVEVRSRSLARARNQVQEGTPGRYAIRLVDLRQNTPQDRNRLDAQAARLDASQLHKQGKKAALEAAIARLNDALALAEAAGDARGEAAALYGLGQVHADLGSLRVAAGYDERAMLQFERLGDRFEEARASLRAGEAHRTMGDVPTGLEYYNRSLLLMRDVKDSGGEGEALADIGEAHFMLRDMQQALRYDHEALSLLRSATDKATVLNNLGAVYRNLGVPEKALAFYVEALPQARAGTDLNLEAVVLDNLGVLHLHGGDWDKALTYFNQALPLRRAVGNKRGEALSLDNIGSVYLGLRQPEKALDYDARALPLLEAVGDRYKQAVVLGNMGHAYGQLGDLPQSLAYHTRASALFEAAGDRLERSKSLNSIAVVQRNQGRFGDARASSEKALELLQFVRAHAGNAEERTAFVAAMSDHFDVYIDLLMRMHAADPSAGHDLEALEASEQARARTLQELLAESYADIRQGVDASLLKQERDLGQGVTAALDTLTKLLARAHTDEQKLAAEKEIAALTDRYRYAQAQIRSASPRYAALTQPQALSATAIQQRVLDPGTMLLEYSLGAEHSYLWAVTTDRVLSRELPARREIEARARRVYESLMSPQPQVGRSAAEQRAPGVKADTTYEKEAMALSRMLLGPVAAELGSKRLVIVADGALHYVPFGALPLPDDKAVANAAPFTPMIAAHEIVSVPSATVLALLREEASGRTPAANAVAVLADPVFSKDDARVGVGPAARRASHGRGASPAAAAASPRERAVVTVRGDDRPVDLPRLLFSRQEAESILAVMPQPSGLAALGFDANRAFAMSDVLSQYRVIHFATHGLLDGKRPELSGLVLSLIDKGGRPQDGFLRLHEIYNLKLNAELVVLSACQTALGREVRGEGLIGLTRGFMYAGTPRVVASLWQVNDAATAQLMRVFYRRMAQEHLTPAAALRAAQLEIMATHRWRAPYHWAAFVLQGEWR